MKKKNLIYINLFLIYFPLQILLSIQSLQLNGRIIHCHDNMCEYTNFGGILLNIKYYHSVILVLMLLLLGLLITIIKSEID